MFARFCIVAEESSYGHAQIQPYLYDAYLYKPQHGLPCNRTVKALSDSKEIGACAKGHLADYILANLRQPF